MVILTCPHENHNHIDHNTSNYTNNNTNNNNIDNIDYSYYLFMAGRDTNIYIWDIISNKLITCLYHIHNDTIYIIKTILITNKYIIKIIYNKLIVKFKDNIYLNNIHINDIKSIILIISGSSDNKIKIQCIFIFDSIYNNLDFLYDNGVSNHHYSYNNNSNKNDNNNNNKYIFNFLEFNYHKDTITAIKIINDISNINTLLNMEEIRRYFHTILISGGKDSQIIFSDYIEGIFI
jgi:hypothetical protein